MIKLFKTQKVLSNLTITALNNMLYKYKQQYNVVLFIVSDNKHDLQVFMNNNDEEYKQIVEQHKIDSKQYYVGILINIIKEI